MVDLGATFNAADCHHDDDDALHSRSGDEASPMALFHAAIIENIGYAPKHIVGDGKLHRFPASKSGRGNAGWYVFHDDDFPAGTYGDWKMDSKFNWRAREASQMCVAERQRLDGVKIEREKKLEAERKLSVAAAKERWARAAPSSVNHSYLRAKNVGPHGIREEQGVLLIPVYRDGELVSLQTIDGAGGKLFARGTRVEGGCYAIGEFGDVILIAEGFATGATLHEATGLCTIAAFNAGNLLPVASRMRENYPVATIIIAADDDLRTEKERGFNPGLRAARKAADAVGAIVAAPLFDRTKDGDAPSDWNDYAASRGKDAVREALRVAQETGVSGSWSKATNDARSGQQVREAPRALYRPLPPAAKFPIEALGDLLAPAARAIVDITQCPSALAGQSVLAAAALAVQAHADLENPATGHTRPVSLFMVTVGATGERKSAADTEALWSMRKRESALREDYNAELKQHLKDRKAWEAASKKAATPGREDDYGTIKDKLNALGDEPPAPIEPMLTCEEPTIEGLIKNLAAGQPSQGVFSDEGGSFIGGHAMSPDNKLKTAAGYSRIWDGSALKRVRVGDGASIIVGKRVSIHLMAQPEAASLLFTDPTLRDQGFNSRLLVAAPASTAGTRFQRALDPSSRMALNRYHARILSILERAPPLACNSRNELEPRVLTFSPKAAGIWRDFADHVEKLLAPGQPFEPIRGFANKLPEHAARVAAVLTLVDNIQAAHVDSEAFERAIMLAQYYAHEALRLFEAGYARPELQRAEALRNWLLKWGEPLISLRAIVRLGPNSIRDTATATAAIKTLVEHGWLAPFDGRAMVEGQKVRLAWSIMREAGE